MPNRVLSKLLPKFVRPKSYLRNVVTGSFYKISDIRGSTDLADIKTQIDTMRALARDSQISTALSYYATDATVMNSEGQIIWATPIDDSSVSTDVADAVNELFKKWNINSYARDHILELATIGNLYIPTTDIYKDDSSSNTRYKVALDNNTIPDKEFDIVPSYKIPPEDIIHIYDKGNPEGFIMNPDENGTSFIQYPESACIHFSLGGLLGDYKIKLRSSDGEDIEYDIKFAQPLMEKAVTPTQTLGLLEDALVLSSLSRTIRFITVNAGNADETEIQDALQQIKDAIEQKLSINTNSGDVQSFVDPQSPNNLIYLPEIDGRPPITITDLNMAETNDADSKLLEHYTNKKLSVLGVPKEAMNFSSNEGLGGAGAVMSQRSALYANSLQRIENAYMEGWREGLNKYFIAKNMSGFVDRFKLNMQPIITEMSTVMMDRRDAATGQAASLVDLLKNLGITDKEPYLQAITEALKDVYPTIGSEALSWDVNTENTEGSEGGMIDDFQ